MTSRWPLLSLLLGIVLASCSGPTFETRREATSGSAAFAEAPQDRPGFGTRWGETRRSTSGLTTFARATPAQPLTTAEIFYNDRAGIEAMAAASPFRRVWPVLSGPASSLISIGLKDQSGRFLPGLVVGERWFVVGEEGRRYTIVVRSRTDLRIEVVLSVDGLDVLDGRPASVRKRGYVLDPHRTLVVEGFRQSAEAVAAFRFGPVRDSYARRNTATPATSASSGSRFSKNAAPIRGPIGKWRSACGRVRSPVVSPHLPNQQTAGGRGGSKAFVYRSGA